MDETARLNYIQPELGLDTPLKETAVEKKSADQFKFLAIEQSNNPDRQLRLEAARVGMIYDGLNIIRALDEHYLDSPVTPQQSEELFSGDFTHSKLRGDIEILKGVAITNAVLRSFNNSFVPSLDGTEFAERLQILASCLPSRLKEKLIRQLEPFQLPNPEPDKPQFKPSYSLSHQMRQKLLKRTFQQVQNQLSRLTETVVIPHQTQRSGIDLVSLRDYDLASLERLLAGLDAPIHDLRQPITTLSVRAELTERILRGRLSESEKKAKFIEYLNTFNSLFESISLNMNRIDNITGSQRLEIQAMFLHLNKYLIPYFSDHHINFSLESTELRNYTDPEMIVARCGVEEFPQLIDEIGLNLKKAFIDKEAKQAEARPNPPLDPRRCVIVMRIDPESKMLEMVFTANSDPYPDQIIENGFTPRGTYRLVAEEGEFHTGMGMYNHQQIIEALGGNLEAENVMIAGELWSQTTIRLPLLSFQHRLPI